MQIIVIKYPFRGNFSVKSIPVGGVRRFSVGAAVTLGEWVVAGLPGCFRKSAAHLLHVRTLASVNLERDTKGCVCANRQLSQNMTGVIVCNYIE